MSIRRQSLGSEETQALVLAMESHEERVGLNEEVTLDIRVLIEYSGQGKCISLECKGDTENRYREKLRTWATSKKWQCEDDQYFDFQRVEEFRARYY